LRRQLEREKESQIKEQLSFDQRVLVSVSVEPDYSSMQVQDSTISEGVALKEETDSTNTVRTSRSGQPGVQPNVGVEVGSGNGADTTTADRSETTYEPSRRTSVTQTPAGVPKSITAAVSLSYSYLTGICRLNNPEVETPTRAQIEEVFAKEKDQVTTQVAKLVIPPEPDQVSVVWHYDTLDPEEEVGTSTTTLDTSLDLVGSYGPTSGLALLALLAIGMMMRLSKRKDAGESFGMEIGLPKEAVEAAKKAADDLQKVARASGRAGASRGAVLSGLPGGEQLDAVSLPIGQGTDGVLEAHEVEESAVRTTQMIEQVSEMTRKDAEGVAQVVESWVDQEN
jgi:flagellar biosynthesis/type III secretory pathway M-ring protein FliF/YscJ